MLITRNLFRFPFDWRNPIGYIIAVAIQTTVVALAAKNPSFTWSFCLASFWFATTITKDLRLHLKNMSKNAKKKKNRAQIMGKLTESLELYRCLKWYAFSTDCTFLDRMDKIFLIYFSSSLQFNQ